MCKGMASVKIGSAHAAGLFYAQPEQHPSASPDLQPELRRRSATKVIALRNTSIVILAFDVGTSKAFPLGRIVVLIKMEEEVATAAATMSMYTFQAHISTPGV